MADNEESDSTTPNAGSSPAPQEEAPKEADSLSMIDKANEAAERLEAANVQHAKLLAIQQKAIVEQTLSGKTEAGIPAQTDEERKIANAKQYLKGTGMDDLFDKPKVD